MENANGGDVKEIVIRAFKSYAFLIFEISRDDLMHKSMSSSNGVEYRQSTAPLFSQYHGNTFDIPNDNVIRHPQNEQEQQQASQPMRQPPQREPARDQSVSSSENVNETIIDESEESESEGFDSDESRPPPPPPADPPPDVKNQSQQNLRLEL